MDLHNGSMGVASDEFCTVDCVFTQPLEVVETMTGITERKSQWEREAIEAERKMIAEWLRGFEVEERSTGKALVLHIVASQIERGEYRKGAVE